MELERWALLLCVGCAAENETRRQEYTDERLRQMNEQSAQAEQQERAVQRSARATQQAGEDRRAARAQATRDDLAAKDKAHADACAASFPERFHHLQDAMVEFPKAKAKLAAECKRLATRCHTISDGPSVCSGLTDEEQQSFDGICRRWPHYRIVPGEDAECNDVGSEALIIDFSWSDQDAADFRKREVPTP
jgi:hypothetical protein